MSVIQDIFTEHYPEYEQNNLIAEHARKAAWSIINCRTSALGGHVQKCPDEHYHRIWYNSCKHRSCPQCSGIQKQEWINKQLERVLDADHYHVIFTLPHKLSELWMLNSRKMTGLLFKSAKDSLFGMLENDKFLGANPVVIATLQTWGETLNLHPHLHCLVTGGGMTDNEEWKPSKKGYLIPVTVLQEIFRGKFLDRLHNLVYNGEIKKPEGMSYSQIHKMLRKLRIKKWNVYVCEKYAYGEGVIKYLGNYIKGGSISNHRVINYNENEIKFNYKDNKENGKKKVMTLDTEEFIRRFLLHVPKPNLKVVRYYGLYASCKRETLNKCRKELGQAKVKEPEEIKWQEYCKEKGGEDLQNCPVCGKELIKGRKFDSEETPIVKAKLKRKTAGS
ncbi:IS91 family transposase [Sporohalobacter salinus]|uniref:IS91 family transposase n=1 Tax=Sporohalobacter salinus TaxID=1494606 RepID=UPI001EF78078|nr:IS91 family transposase [Sporohalobacter salinus]